MRDRRIGMIVITALVLLLPVQFVVYRLTGREPYPGLFMPAFARVLEHNGEVELDRLHLTAASDRGPVAIDPVRLMPYETALAESIAIAFFADEGDVREAAADGWLYERLQSLGVRASSLQVVQERVWVRDEGLQVARREVVAAFTVPISKGAA
jgi:hypothetical protein